MSRDRGRRQFVIGMRVSNEAPWQRLVFGLTLLAAGTLFWLDHIGRIDAQQYLQWWPLALIAMGIAHILERRWFGAAIWLLFGSYFLLPLLGIETIRFWQVLGLWPLLISVAGVMLALQALRRPGGARGVRAVAVMGANIRKIGGDFPGGEAVAVMGGCEIDLSSAKIADEAVLDVLAFWGGISVRVPPDCRVVSNLTPILGGYEDKSARGSDEAPRLVIRGSTIMGGVEVRNAREAD